MAVSETRSDQKKLIAAIGLGVLALILLWWTFFGFGGGSKARRGSVVAGPQSSPAPVPVRTPAQTQTAEELRNSPTAQLREIDYPQAPPAVPEPRRNIFAFYEPPPPAQPAVKPSPSPTPPPLLLATISPASVYARTGDFTLELSGDKFTPAIRVLIDRRELPTRYISPQQLSANVPAAVIADPGSRQVMVRTGDGSLYSNDATLTVNPPPAPNYNYVGIIGTPRHIDTAIIQDKNSKEILNVQRGDVVGGRFRITSVSERELVLVDTNIKVKHTLPFTREGEKGFSPQTRPTPRTEAEDDEP